MRSPVSTVGLLLVGSVLLAAIVIHRCDRPTGGVVQVRSVPTTTTTTPAHQVDALQLRQFHTTAISLSGEELEKLIEKSPKMKATEWYKEFRRGRASTVPATSSNNSAITPPTTNTSHP
jgi:hypothetical protein